VHRGLDEAPGRLNLHTIAYPSPEIQGGVVGHGCGPEIPWLLIWRCCPEGKRHKSPSAIVPRTGPGERFAKTRLRSSDGMHAWRTAL